LLYKTIRDSLIIFNSVVIVLRRIPQSSYKISILDKKKGKTESIVNSFNFAAGSLIRYVVRNEKQQFFLSNMQVIHIPLSLASTDLLFLHHTLEIIYYFASIANYFCNAFNLLGFLYTIEHTKMSLKFKKFFLLKLLTSLEICPELKIIHTFCINQLILIKINQFNDDLISNDIEKKLDKWLWCCIWQHPYVNEFKTVHFLEENRTT